MQRHDSARTATGSSTSSIDTPAVAFRHYLGGALGILQLETYDVDANGSREILLVVGGAVVAKTQDDVVVWETGPLDVSRLDAIADLDGAGGRRDRGERSGRPGPMCSTRRPVRCSGLFRAGTSGVTGAVRLADLNRDGELDLYVADNACGSTRLLARCR
jgi:hypothetical protein